MFSPLSGLFFAISTSLSFMSFCHFVHANDFAGANSYFLYATNETIQNDVLTIMYHAEMKLLRVFITQVYEDSKGTGSQAVNDLETVAVGKYDDTILGLIDDLAVRAKQMDIKLIIAMHDRYALGCDTYDAYVTKYDLPVSSDGCVDDVPDSSAFYLNAVSDYEARISHILNYWSPNYDKPWYQMSDEILAFEIENEAMGHMDVVAPNWWCEMAQYARGIMGTWGVQISTGGGTTISSSMQSQFLTCPDLQILAIHDYDLDTTYIADGVNSAKAAVASAALNQRIIYEEFGGEGSDKEEEVAAAVNVLESTGVPWMYWELLNPGGGSDNYEVWTDESTWSVLETGSQNTLGQGGEFYWPEIQ